MLRATAHYFIKKFRRVLARRRLARAIIYIASLIGFNSVYARHTIAFA